MNCRFLKAILLGLVVHRQSGLIYSLLPKVHELVLDNYLIFAVRMRGCVSNLYICSIGCIILHDIVNSKYLQLEENREI